MSEPDPSVRHVPKLLELIEGQPPLYRCQACRRQGTLDELKVEECPSRSGVIRRVLPPPE